MKSKSVHKNNTLLPVLVVAGEVSGDNLGGWILRELNKLGHYNFFGAGGAQMAKAGIEAIYQLEDLCVVGITEVLFKYRGLLKKADHLVKECKKREAHYALLIDFPGFNLKLAQKLRAEGIVCIQISSPQIWAWRYGRIEKIRSYIASVLCFYPFEKEIYDRENIDSFYMGHPIVASLKKIAEKQKGKAPLKKKTIVLLPGSRRMEIDKLLPYMIELAALFHEEHKDYVFVIPAASDKVAAMIDAYPRPKFITRSNKPAGEILSTAYAAVACSGTVTLECSFFKVPFFLVYKASRISYMVAKRLMQTNHIGMPNIILDREVVKEFLQHKVSIKETLPELKRIVLDNEARTIIKRDLSQVAKHLGSGNAAQKAARYLAKKLI